VLQRILAIALNSYREAVRARVLYGLFGLALATTLYSVILGAMSLHQEKRVVSDVSAASISLYAVLVAIVLGSTSLHREIELKTLFPILTRRLVRHEFVLGKFVGTWLTLGVFVMVDGGTALGLLAHQSGRSLAAVAGAAAGLLALLGVGLWRLKAARAFLLAPWSVVFFAVMALLAAPAAGERSLVLASCALTMLEVAIVTAITLFFSAFSSPFLTAIFTAGIFILGRSAETLANLPVRVVGPLARSTGSLIARVVPNLNLYVPERPVLLGQVDGVPVVGYVARCGVNALCYSALLLVLASLIFRKRDLQ
jgi:hypothetical protein